MLNKIKDFAEQAGFSFTEEGSLTQGHTYAEVEKMVFLIIAAGVKDIKEWRDATDAQMYTDPHWQGYRSGCNDAIVELQTLFSED